MFGSEKNVRYTKIMVLCGLVKVNEPAVDSLHAPSSAIKATILFASTISVLGEHLLLFWAIS